MKPKITRVYLKNGDFVDVRPLTLYEQIAVFSEICKLARVNASCDLAHLSYLELSKIAEQVVQLTNQQNADFLEIPKRR